MTIRGPGFQLFIGRRRNRPITYDDLLDAETRCANAEEAICQARVLIGTGRGLDPADLKAVTEILDDHYRTMEAERNG